jgi:glutamate dehydrogenase
MEELASANPVVLADTVASQLKFIATRQPGETLIRVFNPERKKHGWDSEHTVIEMVNDDKPFLVDTATLALSEMNLDVHLIIHPVIRVRRGQRGRLTRITNRDDPEALTESVVQIQVNRQTSDDRCPGGRRTRIRNSWRSARRF